MKSIVKRATNDMYGLPAGAAGDNQAEAAKDKGPVALPKLFRRLVGFSEKPQGAAGRRARRGERQARREA